MKLSRISSAQISRMPDQTSEWLNRLNEKVDALERASSTSSAPITELPIASGSQLGVVMVGSGLSITSSGVLSATGVGPSSYNTLTDKPQINGHTLSGNQSFADLGLTAITNNDIDTIIGNI